MSDEEVSLVMSEPSWMDPIWDYLVDRTLLSDPKEASKLRMRSARFTIHRGALLEVKEATLALYALAALAELSIELALLARSFI